MKMNEETALAVAEFLLQIKAIKLDVNKPFTWASGLKSPIYCDNRKTLSFPKIRTYIRQEFVKLINEAYGPMDLVVGVATGAIAQGVLVAQDLGLPFAYVRSTKKEHGLENKIEGVVESGQNVIVVEDLVSTGQSSLDAVKALRDFGCNVKGMVAIFTYNLKIAEENFKAMDCSLNTLTDYDHLIKKALEQDYIKDFDLKSLIEWRENPQEWGEKFNISKPNITL
ncbi:MAG: orotate phosphoribosyltransferase [Bacteroidota bacterium]|nr:orotate phosphoribosyltransferase [Bacillota bacterium]MDP4289913.1 orotate phosphoribosyltransferase [Bacteroidota bacterium]